MNAVQIHMAVLKGVTILMDFLIVVVIVDMLLVWTREVVMVRLFMIQKHMLIKP